MITVRGGKFAFSELDELQDVPNFRTYQDRFGGTRNVCELLGDEYSHVFKRSESCRRTKEIRSDLMQQLVDADPTHVSLYTPQGRGRKSHLRVRGAASVGVYVCRWFSSKHGRPPRWNISMTPRDRYPTMLLALLDETNTRIDSLLLVKGFRFTYRTLHIGRNNRLLKDGVLVGGMSELYSANKKLQQVRWGGMTSIRKTQEKCR
jgi:hypothetical protein